MTQVQTHSNQAAEEAQGYYRLTESSYRYLDVNGTNFMNLGKWPSADIRTAQANLIRATLDLLSTEDQMPRILELGPGWGGSRAIVEEKWPGCSYIAINSSAKQIEYSRQLNSDFESTYLQGYFEDLNSLVSQQFDIAIGIESLLHVEKKHQVLSEICNSGVSKLAFAEICTENLTEVLKNKLFNPSLKYLWSNENYTECLRNLGFNKVKIIDISEQVFSPWSRALNAIRLEDFMGHPRILRQFQFSYSALAELAKDFVVQYSLIVAER